MGRFTAILRQRLYRVQTDCLTDGHEERTEQQHRRWQVEKRPHHQHYEVERQDDHPWLADRISDPDGQILRHPLCRQHPLDRRLSHDDELYRTGHHRGIHHGVRRELPDENLRILRTLTTRRGQLVDMRKRLKAQISARKKQGVSADVETMDDDLQNVLGAQISVIEQRIENVIAQTEPLAAKANLLRSIPGIGPVSAAMLIAELPELGRMTSGEAAAIIGLAPVPHDSGAMRGRRAIAGGRRSLRHVLFQAALAAACHNPVLKPVAKRLKERGKPHKLVIIAIARRLITIANAIIKTGIPWQIQPGE